MQERLQKILSRNGYGSRRNCEKIIASGRVMVNGKLAVLGNKADSLQDDIRVDNQIIKSKVIKGIYIALNKPPGVISDIVKKDNRPIVRDFIPLKNYLFIVGRLDKNSEGLIILTNDGDVANKLTHPRYEHEKEYAVLLSQAPDEKQLNAWRHGIVIKSGYRTKSAIVKLKKKTPNGYWFKIIMHEGKKRQIREIGTTIGLHIKRIIRKRIANIHLGELKKGNWRFLTEKEIMDLKKIA